jgi:hypothetical protein
MDICTSPPAQVPVLVRYRDQGASEIRYAAEIPSFFSRVLGIEFPTIFFFFPATKTQYSVQKVVNWLRCNVVYKCLSPAYVMKAPSPI